MEGAGGYQCLVGYDKPACGYVYSEGAMVYSHNHDTPSEVANVLLTRESPLLRHAYVVNQIARIVQCKGFISYEIDKRKIRASSDELPQFEIRFLERQLAGDERTERILDQYVNKNSLTNHDGVSNLGRKPKKPGKKKAPWHKE